MLGIWVSGWVCVASPTNDNQATIGVRQFVYVIVQTPARDIKLARGKKKSLFLLRFPDTETN